ncbi:hypothetical protein [Rhodoferax sp.]|uniref:hypothetical protein n=1 Tax=Rhodoferax sp. TaxID=50421 RepID=UPI00374D068D
MTTEAPKFKLAIEDILTVRVKIQLLSGGVWKKFDYTLFAKRMDQDAVTITHKEDGEQPVAEFVQKVATGWEGQRLVLNDDNTPAAFDPEALKALLSVPGVATLTYQAYMRDLGAREKN